MTLLDRPSDSSYIYVNKYLIALIFTKELSIVFTTNKYAS